MSRRNESLGLVGKEKYFKDQWDYYRADLRAEEGEGWTDMELVGVDDGGDFSYIKVSLLFSLLGQL